MNKFIALIIGLAVMVMPAASVENIVAASVEYVAPAISNITCEDINIQYMENTTVFFEVDAPHGEPKKMWIDAPNSYFKVDNITCDNGTYMCAIFVKSNTPVGEYNVTIFADQDGQNPHDAVQKSFTLRVIDDPLVKITTELNDSVKPGETLTIRQKVTNNGTDPINISEITIESAVDSEGNQITIEEVHVYFPDGQVVAPNGMAYVDLSIYIPRGTPDGEVMIRVVLPDESL